MKQGRKDDAVLFAELHRRMNSQGVWHNGWAILHLLLVLSDEHAVSPAHSIVSNVCICMHVCACVCVCLRACVCVSECECVRVCVCLYSYSLIVKFFALD